MAIVALVLGVCFLALMILSFVASAWIEFTVSDEEATSANLQYKSGHERVPRGLRGLWGPGWGKVYPSRPWRLAAGVWSLLLAILFFGVAVSFMV